MNKTGGGITAKDVMKNPVLAKLLVNAAKTMKLKQQQEAEVEREREREREGEKER